MAQYLICSGKLRVSQKAYRDSGASEMTPVGNGKPSGALSKEGMIGRSKGPLSHFRKYHRLSEDVLHISPTPSIPQSGKQELAVHSPHTPDTLIKPVSRHQAPMQKCPRLSRPDVPIVSPYV